MAHRKAGGSAKSLRDSKPKYLGIKLYAGQKVLEGQIITRQRGTKQEAGENVGIGKDHTLFAKKSGTIETSKKRKQNWFGKSKIKTFVHVK